jgi:hypothetical protein
MQIIEITVAAHGGTRVETRGFAGASCRQASAFVEQALGQRVNEHLTSEFYVPIPQTQMQQEQQ